MQYNSRIVVCDNGTGMVKAGFAGDNYPTATFPSILGKPLIRAEDESIGDIKLKPLMIGDECIPAMKHLDVSYPVDNGIILKWNDMEQLWRYTFHNKLGLNIDDSGKLETKDMRIMLTEAPLNPKENRKRMVETLFEKFDFAGVQCKTQAILTLYSAARTTGMVVDSGDGVTHCIGVYDGYLPSNLTRRLNIAGRHITRHFLDLLQSKGYALNSSSDFEMVREMKEKYCYIASNFKQETKLLNETTCLVEKYTLPDGREIKLDNERFEAPEILFQPHLIGMETGGISDMVFDCIQDAAVDIRMDLYKNIVLSGGTTMFPGFAPRLESDIKQLYTNKILKGESNSQVKKISVNAPPFRKHSVFCGASIYANMIAAKADIWLSKQEWEEQGEKCLSKLL